MSNSQFSGYWLFQVLIISKCMHGAIVAAFCINARSGEDAAIKEEVEGSALNSHGNYIADYGKSWKNYGNVFLNFWVDPDRVEEGRFCST